LINYLIDKLKLDTSITAIVGTNIVPLSRLEGTSVPAIVLQMVDATAEETKARSINLDTTTVEVTTLANTPKAAWDISILIRSSINGYSSGDDILSCQFSSWASDVFDSKEVFTITSTYIVLNKIANV
tara:strand:+ start:115 stop:498 length:384 start_codon:yes stop_codon:yes gene_type:complete